MSVGLSANPDSVVQTYCDQANKYQECRDYDSSLMFLNLAIYFADSTKDEKSKALVYRQMANHYYYLNEFDSARLYYKKVLNIKPQPESIELTSDYIGLSLTYLEHGFTDSALYYINIARQHWTQHQDSIICTSLEIKLLKKDIEYEKGKSYYLLILALFLTFTGIVSLILFYFIRKNALTRKQLAESKATALEAKLEGQKRELTLGALSLSRNLEFINSLINELSELSGFVTTGGMRPLNNIVKKLGRQQSNSCWKEFEKRFSEIHSNFYSRLLEEYPTLTQSEVKLCAFLKLGMNTKEICSLTFQNVRAIEASRLRLRKKLNITSCENLSMFLQKY